MIEIKTKDDIVIPFALIGDEKWIENTRLILDTQIEYEGGEISVKKSNDEIASLEERIKTSLPKELALFYKNFGIADIGEILVEFDEINWLKNIWDNPEFAPDFSDEDKVHLPFLITFSDYLGNGNMFCFHSETKEIYYFDHDSKPYITKMFDNVSDYIKGCLISCQAEFFDIEYVKPDLVEDWCEDILIDLYGEHIVHKWKY